MSYKLFPTPPTPSWVAKILRRHLSSEGYYIFSLAKRWCVTSYDFVAVPKDNVNGFIVVRARRTRVQGLPFCLSSNTIPGKKVFEELKYNGTPVTRLGPQVDLRRMNLKLEHFVTPRQHAELARLFPQLELKVA